MRVDLDELERLEKAAFCVPWNALSTEWGEEGEGTGNWFAHGPTHERHECEECDGVGWCDSCAEDNEGCAMNDAKLIAATRNAMPAIIAELRAARECAAMLMQAYKVGAIAHWFDEDGDGGEFVLAKYDEAVKGDG